MNKTLIIICREYLTRVKKKSFIITTIAVPFLMALLMLLPILMTKFKTGKDRIAVIDLSGKIVNKLDNTDNISFTYVNSDLENMKQNFSEQGYSGILYIPDFELERPFGFSYFSEKQPGINLHSHITRNLRDIVQKYRYEMVGLDEQILKKLEVDLTIDTFVLSKEGEKSGNTLISSILSQILGFILYFSLLIYGSTVTKGVMEEKNSRIVEVIMSSVKPVQLLFGKIIGIVAVALTQFTIWIIIMVLMNFMIGAIFAPELSEVQSVAAIGGNQIIAQPQTDSSEIVTILNDLRSLDTTYIIIIALFYFLGGYLLYASMFAAIGSVGGDDADNQTLTLPVTLPIIVSFILMLNVLEDPSGKLAFWASMIPLSSPIVMVARIPFGVPFWQIFTSLFLLFSGFIVSTYAAAKIYKTGILLYGKKVTFKELFKWVFYKS
ncbi:MAG: ABC transporter permease [Candidatus Cloacimonetes bacterium]|nr:ABC transporter permease [Candidatus Cloacimonadota bacterium]